MKQRAWDVRVLLKQNIKALIMRVCLLALGPVFCNLVLASGAQALSLPGVIREVTAPVTYLLPSAPVAPVYAVPPQIAPVAAPVAPVVAPQSSSDSSNTERTASVVNKGIPLTNTAVAGAELGLLSPIDQNLLRANKVNHRVVLVAAQRGAAPQNSFFAFLQPSEQGWKVAGVAWYWWALAGVAIWLGVRTVRRAFGRHIMQKPLVS